MLSSMLLNAEDSERLVRAAIAALPDEDPVLVALTFGMAAGHENAAYLVAKQLASYGVAGTFTRRAVLTLLGAVCDEADRLAAMLLSPEMVVPSREVRMEGRGWLREGFEFGS